jgi:hypothetical protein
MLALELSHLMAAQLLGSTVAPKKAFYQEGAVSKSVIPWSGMVTGAEVISMAGIFNASENDATNKIFVC